ncbi:uncharacterized protein LOC135343270 isoform X2 [Halichondria panicea]|uniref:uncharacterized protein LOC135343270 isoform X2 n=1 Tax=Halichondria panicea TaxID=6063 RepID=UPI00312B8C69
MQSLLSHAQWTENQGKAIPDSQPAMALFRAGGCEKRKGKSVAALKFSQNYVFLTTKNQESVKFAYENIVSVDITERKNEVAIVCKRPVESNSYWCVCLKLKTAKGFQKGKLSKSRKITGKEIQQLLQPLLCTSSPLRTVSAPPKDELLVSRSFVSDIAELSESEQEDTTNYNYATVLSDEIERIIASQETEVEQYNQEFDSLEVYDAEQESASREFHGSENTWEFSDYNTAILKCASCPIIYMEPCEVDCEPTEDEYGLSKRHLSQEVTLTNALQLSDEAYYARNWNLSAGYFYFEQTQQTAQQASAFPIVQSATPGYNYTAQYSSTAMNYYYNAYLTCLWQLQYTLCPPTPEASSSTEPDACVCINCLQGRAFKPSVLERSPELAFGLDHSPAFCFVGEQYETSPHILYTDRKESLMNSQAPLDINAIESDC